MLFDCFFCFFKIVVWYFVAFVFAFFKKWFAFFWHWFSLKKKLFLRSRLWGCLRHFTIFMGVVRLFWIGHNRTVVYPTMPIWWAWWRHNFWAPEEYEVKSLKSKIPLVSGCFTNFRRFSELLGAANLQPPTSLSDSVTSTFSSSSSWSSFTRRYLFLHSKGTQRLDFVWSISGCDQHVR